ncbi:MAG: ABC transporter ATP-binding protein [Bacilli bacterium]|nr:ABC transporter ATP-binding protein [Bacilli bacterium]
MGKIVISHLSKIYNQGLPNEVRALDDVSFELEEGELVVILGPSGAGKSTLLNILGGMDTATSGSYIISGRDVGKFKTNELTDFRRKDIGFVFQFYNLVPNLTALENVSLAASVSNDPIDPSKALEAVGLSARAHNFPSQLSGGEQQRTAIARAVAKNPELLLADEPTGALDSKTGAEILSLLHHLSKAYKKTVIMVTHNAQIALMAERVIRIADGHIAENKINENPADPKDIHW